MRKREQVEIPDVDTDTVVAVLESTPVTLAVLYGSRARGTATERSDIDIAVEFDEALSSSERTHARLALIERLSAKLSTDEVDVVPISRMSDELLGDVFEDGILLHGSPERLNAYAERVSETAREDDPATFDELLTRLDRVV